MPCKVTGFPSKGKPLQWLWDDPLTRKPDSNRGIQSFVCHHRENNPGKRPQFWAVHSTPPLQPHVGGISQLGWAELLGVPWGQVNQESGLTLNPEVWRAWKGFQCWGKRVAEFRKQSETNKWTHMWQGENKTTWASSTETQTWESQNRLLSCLKQLVCCYY